MSGFSAEWLALREAADWRSRSLSVTEAVACALAPGRVIRAVDLAAGTGSNSRFLARALPAPQEWLLVDHDPALLARARQLAAFDFGTQTVDLSRPEHLTAILASHNLVSASALLDLVSDAWLRAVIATCRKTRAVLLFTLTYDGRLICTPAEPEDEMVRQLVNRHQHTDKGFGPALGPEAVERASELLQQSGYAVVRDRSDWALDPQSGELQRQLIEGWAEAAAAIAPGEAGAIAGWRRRRLDHVIGRRSHLIVGHEDLGAFMA